MATPFTSDMRPYPLDNDHTQATHHLTGLAATLDMFTQSRISTLLELTDKNCLEVGAGSGSIAAWMAEQVGPGGHVTATDIKPGHIPAHPRMSVLTHDLTSDPLPPDAFHLIHARLVLAHLPTREEILRRLVDALAPGGIVLLEDWDATSGVGGVLHAPDPQVAHLYAVYMKRRAEIFSRSGTDRSWARRVHSILVRHGMTQVNTVVHAASWTGGSPGSRHARATLRQLRPQLIDTGMNDAQLEGLIAVLDDPRLHVATHPLYSTSARRPTPTDGGA
jgi:SAM-dependent methyltransferase